MEFIREDGDEVLVRINGEVVRLTKDEYREARLAGKIEGAPSAPVGTAPAIPDTASKVSNVTDQVFGIPSINPADREYTGYYGRPMGDPGQNVAQVTNDIRNLYEEDPILDIANYQLSELEIGRLTQIDQGSPLQPGDGELIEKANTLASLYNEELRNRQAAWDAGERTYIGPEGTRRWEEKLSASDIGGRYMDGTGKQLSDEFATNAIENNAVGVFVMGQDGTIYPMNDRAEGETFRADEQINTYGVNEYEYMFDQDETGRLMRMGAYYRPGDEGFDTENSIFDRAASQLAPHSVSPGRSVYAHEDQIPPSAVVGRTNVPDAEINNYTVSGFVSESIMPGESKGARMVLLPIGDPNVMKEEVTPGEEMPLDEPGDPMKLRGFNPEKPDEIDPVVEEEEVVEKEKDPLDPMFGINLLAHIAKGLESWNLEGVSVQPMRFDQAQYESPGLGPAVTNLFRGGH